MRRMNRKDRNLVTLRDHLPRELLDALRRDRDENDLPMGDELGRYQWRRWELLERDRDLWTRYLGVISSLVPPDFALDTLSTNTTVHGYDYVRAHRDHPYTDGTFPLDPSGPTLSWQTVLALDDAPGTFLLARPGTDLSVSPEDVVLEPCDLYSGDILVLDARTVHSAGPNRTGHRQTKVLATFIHPFVPSLAAERRARGL